MSTHRGQVFFKISRWQVTTFQIIAGSSSFFFNSYEIYCFLCAAQLKFWFQTDLGLENSASYYRQGRQLLLTLLTVVKRWSRCTSNVYALIIQNFTGEFMRKIYAASWILFALTAEADRVLRQLVKFLTFSTGCTKWNSAAIRSLLLFMASLFIGFLVEKYIACQSQNSDCRWHHFRFHLAWCVRGLQSLKRHWSYLIPFRSRILNGKPK